MNNRENLQPKLRQQANELLRRLSPAEREALIIKCWMSHDARWFMAVAREYGMEAANRVNQAAVYEIGKVEAPRVLRALKLPPVKTVDDCLLAQETIIGLFGPDLLDYDVIKVGDNACRVHVKRCFAEENATRVGVADQFECGIFARCSGWLEALGMEYEMTPPLGKCMKAQGQECIRTFIFKVKPGV
jgi:hypothetical protein